MAVTAALDLSSWADRNRVREAAAHKDAERLVGDVASSRKAAVPKATDRQAMGIGRVNAPALELEPITKPLQRGRETGRQTDTHMRSLSLSPSARQNDLAAKRAQYEQANAEYMALMKAAKAKKSSKWDDGPATTKRNDRLPSLPQVKPSARSAIPPLEERPSARTPPPISGRMVDDVGPADANPTLPDMIMDADDAGGYFSGQDADDENKDAAKKKSAARIRVIVRKRPLNDREGGEDCVDCLGNAVHVNATKLRVDLTAYQESHHYAFDDACGDLKSNRDVYETCARDLITTVFEGGSASCFAYGQTGSGKTHTMIGSETEPGIYILAAEDIFARCSDNHRVFVSLYEIYCNMLYDLLNQHNMLQAREDANKKVNICGLTWHEIRSVKDLLRVIDKGMKERRTGSTSANEFSSRSHAVMTITLRDEDQPKFIGSLNVVDLAGSERAADTAANDKQTRHEGAEINKSLLALKECIRGLDEGKKHIQFRTSKLTEVLRDSFVGNSRTAMIATVGPSSVNAEHTLNTLRYAFRVKGLSFDCPMPSKERNAPRPTQRSKSTDVDAAVVRKEEKKDKERKERDKRRGRKGRTPRKHYGGQDDGGEEDAVVMQEMAILKDQLSQVLSRNAVLDDQLQGLQRNNMELLHRVALLESRHSTTLPPIAGAAAVEGTPSSRPQSENRASRRSRRKHRSHHEGHTASQRNDGSPPSTAAAEELVTLEELAG